ncbi:elicitor-responsive protein 1-like isoform X2 [Musa acuminata AAA Group]|uniref:elicitor-responsive protein 1-like isoform X2 n=1 Tax=Musa acuminata AAA Group TaxID=214697 RepID=UPI0031DB7C1E
MSIQGQLLEVTVVGCNKLKDTEWISRQDPYVILEYATTKFRTRTCTDGGRNPSFQEKTALSLIEGLREISVSVWNSNTVSYDDFIGSGRVQLSKVLAQGYDDSCWSIQSRSGRYSGEVKLIMHYANAGKAEKPAKSATPSSYAPTAPPYNPAPQYASPYMPPKAVDSFSYPPAAYPPAGYPQVPDPALYQPAIYPPPLLQQQYPPTYPPTQTYLPPQPYPPPPGQPCYPPAYPGVYPPPPY